MRLSAVTVWYNPDESCVKNILTYSFGVEKCYIIDNSDSDNSELSSKITNAVYLPNMANLGIAKALNIGCEKALTDGFEWCMTMDQDSSWESEQLQIYLGAVEKKVSQKAVSFAPAVSKHDFGKSEIPVNKVITSGNVINLGVWNEVGRFYEPFFIDEVDNEFCYRVREHDYEILQIQSVHMNHHLGDERKHVLPLLCHSGVRLYYMVRNALFIKNMHPQFYKTEHYTQWLRYFSFRIVIEGMLRLKFKNIVYLLRAKHDFAMNKLGKY